jgi:hypothetical protein
VIDSNGLLREPDELDARRRSSYEGSATWRAVGRDEIALRCKARQFEVAYVPASGANAAQIAAIAKIEIESLGEEAGVFGLDQVLKARQIAVEAVVAAVVPKCITCGNTFKTSGQYVYLVHQNGVNYCCPEGVYAYLRQHRSRTPSALGCSNRDALVVQSFTTEFGMVEIVTYYWGGDDNVSIRLRPFTPGEEAASEPEPGPEMAPDAGMASLLAKFGKPASLGSVGKPAAPRKGGKR